MLITRIPPDILASGSTNVMLSLRRAVPVIWSDDDNWVKMGYLFSRVFALCYYTLVHMNHVSCFDRPVIEIFYFLSAIFA